MTVYNGTKGNLMIAASGSTGTVGNIAHWTLTVTADANDCTMFGNRWRDFKGGCVSWTVSGDGFWDGAAGQTGVHALLTAGTIAQAYLYVDTTVGAITTVAAAPTVAGTGYTVNDVLTVLTGSADATVTITGIGGASGVTGIELTTGGVRDYTVSTGNATHGTGGTGCTIEITAVGGMGYSGKGYLTGETIDEQVCGVVAISFDFQGTGTLSTIAI